MYPPTGRLPSNKNFGFSINLHNRPYPMGQLRLAQCAGSNIGNKAIKIGSHNDGND
jgi:hypothetical protein